MILQDTYRHKGLRRKLIASIREKGITNEKILSAMGRLPRHLFLDRAFEEQAYEDKAFPIGKDQTISQPYTVAYQTNLLEIKKRDKILEVGTGSGYQAIILAMLGARVHTLERHEFLYQKAQKIIEDLKVNNIRVYLRDGFKGLPELAPFDKILVTAGATGIPEDLKNQLAIGGIMVIPVGPRDLQTMVRVTRISENKFDIEKLDNFRFVPFLKGIDKK
ncbi:MAG: protein-L-isoaspartate(D-aspartate) O-methyltransferase [Saprospiraceae bacterium]